MPPAPPSPCPCIVVAHADSCTQDLLHEWLAQDGFMVACEDLAPDARPPAAARLVIVDLPFPRQAGPELIRQVALRYPHTPILALSSAFFANVECCGGVADSLGVAGVVPKPITREALCRAVRQVLPP